MTTHCGRNTSHSRKRPVASGREAVISPTNQQLSHLTGPEAKAVAALSDAMFPVGGAFEAGAASVGTVAWIDDYLGRLPRQQRLLLRGMFMLFETDVTANGPRRFSSASAEERSQILHRWETSELYARRASFLALKGTLLMAFLSDVTVRSQLGIIPGNEALIKLQREAEAALGSEEA
ncbi:MAG: gluconate 2-dehydrogenase subunit 3 family protein [Deltaproteobacteria bacterium]|nr:gluconate 2-dehydrogenase subunit 3 family protein [Deltaproteobacteria bacterium]